MYNTFLSNPNGDYWRVTDIAGGVDMEVDNAVQHYLESNRVSFFSFKEKYCRLLASSLVMYRMVNALPRFAVTRVLFLTHAAAWNCLVLPCDTRFDKQ